MFVIIAGLPNRTILRRKGEDDDSDAARLAAIRDSEERTNCTLTNMEDKFADMEKKIDELTGMLQTLLEKE